MVIPDRRSVSLRRVLCKKKASQPKAYADLNLFKNNHHECTYGRCVHKSNIKRTQGQNGADIGRAQCNTQRADTPHSRQNQNHAKTPATYNTNNTDGTGIQESGKTNKSVRRFESVVKQSS